MEYSPQAWLHFRWGDINLLERVQRTFTGRILFKCGLPPRDYVQRLEFLGLETLELKRIKADLVLLFKIISGQSGLSNDPAIRLVNSSTRGSVRKAVTVLPSFDDPSRCCFFNRSVPLWNSLPADVSSADSVDSFKRRLTKINLQSLFSSRIR